MTEQNAAPVIATSSEPWDAIVVGSGITGGFAAMELTKRGLRTLVLERGPDVVHGQDYIYEHKRPWQIPSRGLPQRRHLEDTKPVQSRTGFMTPTMARWFVDDVEHPYIEERPFSWIRGYQVGGRSLTWGRQSYRLGDLDFEANAREGIAVDWPVRYQELAPWYDYVEGIVGISGRTEGLSQLPDGNFLPPMGYSRGEEFFKSALEKNFDDRMMTIGRTAVITEAHGGRAPCHYCGPCPQGCSTGSYFSSQSVTLPLARATGLMTLRPDSVVESVLFDPMSQRASGVRVIDRITKEEVEYRGKLVFLCASTIASTQIMLNSRSERFPNGIANDSGALGHYLMDHHFKVSARGRLPGMLDRYTEGYRPNGIYIPRFRNLDQASKAPDFLRGYGYQGGSSRQSWRGREMQGFGESLKADLREPGPWTMSIGAFGEMLPSEDNRISLDDSQRDAWGMPLVSVSCEIGENELAMRKDMQTSAVEMLEAAGATDIDSYDLFQSGGIGAEAGLAIHEMGTARMGRDPASSVLNGFNQAHSVANLFVTDGSCMTSSACQNPSLTYMALTARAVDHAVAASKRREI